MRDRFYPQKFNLRFHKLRLGQSQSRARCSQSASQSHCDFELAWS